MARGISEKETGHLIVNGFGSGRRPAAKTPTVTTSRRLARDDGVDPVDCGDSGEGRRPMAL